MAPTICSEKEYRSRNRVRESIQKPTQNNNQSNYVGKITNRRSIAARNAKSIKFSIINSYENDTTMYESNSTIIDNNNQQQHHHHNQTTIRHSVNLSSTTTSSSSSALNDNHNEFNENINDIDNNTPTTTSINSSFSSICDRLTIIPNQFFNNNNNNNNNTTENINNKNLYLYQKQSLKFIHQNNINNNSIFYDTSSSQSTSSSSSNHQQLNCIPTEEIKTSTNCIIDDKLNDIKLNRKIIINNNSDNKKYIKSIQTTNSKGLVDIALKTITLIRRNQLLQKKLLQLQLETKEFIQSVMSNPENQTICNIKN